MVPTPHKGAFTLNVLVLPKQDRDIHVCVPSLRILEGQIMCVPCL